MNKTLQNQEFVPNVEFLLKRLDHYGKGRNILYANASGLWKTASLKERQDFSSFSKLKIFLKKQILLGSDDYAINILFDNCKITVQLSHECLFQAWIESRKTSLGRG